MQLPDGRTLGYASYGSGDGKHLFYGHGYPGARVEAAGLATYAAQAGLRLIAIDQPGMGRSGFQLGRRLLDWPADVMAVAGHLSIDRFAVLGVSGGGPYALACASQIPDRLTACGVACGIGPLDGGTAGPDAPLVADAAAVALRTALSEGRRRQTSRGEERAQDGRSRPNGYSHASGQRGSGSVHGGGVSPGRQRRRPRGHPLCLPVGVPARGYCVSEALPLAWRTRSARADSDGTGGRCQTGAVPGHLLSGGRPILHPGQPHGRDADRCEHVAFWSEGLLSPVRRPSMRARKRTFRLNPLAGVEGNPAAARLCSRRHSRSACCLCLPACGGDRWSEGSRDAVCGGRNRANAAYAVHARPPMRAIREGFPGVARSRRVPAMCARLSLDPTARELRPPGEVSFHQCCAVGIPTTLPGSHHYRGVPADLCGHALHRPPSSLPDDRPVGLHPFAFTSSAEVARCSVQPVWKNQCQKTLPRCLRSATARTDEAGTDGKIETNDQSFRLTTTPNERSA